MYLNVHRVGPLADSGGSEPQVVVKVDWSRPVSAKKPHFTSFGMNSLVLIEGTDSGTIRKQIDGLDYNGMELFQGKRVRKTVLLSALMRREQDPIKALDMLIEAKISFRLEIEKFTRATLKDTASGKQLSVPVVLAPGSYRLRAEASGPNQ